MRRDQRPVSEQIKSGLIIAASLVVICAAILVCLSLVRYRAEAWIWHLRNGDSVRVGDFKVPVPSEFLVWRFETGSAQYVQLLNTKGGEAQWASITVGSEARRLTPADFVTRQQKLVEGTGFHISSTKQLVVAGADGVCLDADGTMVGIPMRHISCRFGPNLSVEYVGSAIKANAFYGILTAISKAS